MAQQKEETPSARVIRIMKHCEGLLLHAVTPEDATDEELPLITVRVSRTQKPDEIKFDVVLSSNENEFNEPAILHFSRTAKLPLAVVKMKDLQPRLIGHMLLFLREIEKVVNVH